MLSRSEARYTGLAITAHVRAYCSGNIGKTWIWTVFLKMFFEVEAKEILYWSLDKKKHYSRLFLKVRIVKLFFRLATESRWSTKCYHHCLLKIMRGTFPRRTSQLSLLFLLTKKKNKLKSASVNCTVCVFVVKRSMAHLKRKFLKTFKMESLN